MPEHKIVVEKFDPKRWSVRDIYYYYDDMNMDLFGEHYELSHVAVCPTCKRARGLTKFEYKLLKKWQRCSNCWNNVDVSEKTFHNALFNIAADGNVEVEGL